MASDSSYALRFKCPLGTTSMRPAYKATSRLSGSSLPAQRFEEIPIRYPEARKLYLNAIKETVPVYEGTVVLERELIAAQKQPSTELMVQGEFRYQACDDKKCYVPETVPLVWRIQFEPHDSREGARGASTETSLI